jgi:hypothetical protein
MTNATVVDHAPGVDRQPFSLMQGGLLHRAGQILGAPAGGRGLIYLGLGLAVLTWLPLLVFAIAAGTIADERTVPFLAGIGVHMRRLDLKLLPTHPDLAGGLGILAVAHVALCPLNFALSAILVGDYAQHLRYVGADARDLLLRVLMVIIASTFLLVAPLLVFIPRLLAAKQRGALEYGELATSYAQAFDAKWLRGANPSNEPLLGTADVQSLADLGNSYEVIRQMKVVPISRSQVLILSFAAAVPAILLVNYVMPFDEMIIRGVQTLLHM